MGCLKLHIEPLPNLRVIHREKRQKHSKKTGSSYPFGLKHKGYNNIVSANSNSAASKFGFMGMEHQDELGLGWIDITARNYDPALGRWMNLDPLAEKFVETSPYDYAKNNPVFFVDPNGQEPVPGPFTGAGWKSSNGTITVHRITSGQRYALNVYYATSVAATGWIGQAVGGYYSIKGTADASQAESAQTHAGVITQVASQAGTDLINSEAISGNASKGKPSYIGEAFDKSGKKIINGNPVKSVVNKVNGVAQYAGVVAALTSDSSPSSNEIVSKWTFEFAEAFIPGGDINIAQEGLFQVRDANSTVGGVESRLNAIHSSISVFLAGAETEYDLSTTEGQAGAVQYIEQNAKYIAAYAKEIYRAYNNKKE